MYCKKCHAANENNALKCMKCGEPLQGKIHSNTKDIPARLTLSILAALLCFPFGIVAIIYALKTKRLLRVGDDGLAQKTSERAKIWCWVSLIIGISLFIILLMSVGCIIYFQSHKPYVAIIGKEKITLEEYQEVSTHRFGFFEKLQIDGKKEYFFGRPFNTPETILENLIDMKLLLQSARKLRIDVTENELRDTISNIPIFRNQRGFDINRYSQFLGNNRIKPEEFERSIKNWMMIHKLVDQVSVGIQDEKDKAAFIERYITGLKSYVKIVIDNDLIKKLKLSSSSD